ncbi:unnamed protein product [Bursaphelenchus okinawaensis]|uniref:Aurora kinase n=1 Tax=Bursaphelenchus okinawaensis TaxID=465554 RepID=A0A811L821_9BILA|nr:unnamed protein product [Bursaphelenchus okinawaensis]CAG9118454.1 unnamed protein product [Bursaphelenchus okinawaensis]
MKRQRRPDHNRPGQDRDWRLDDIEVGRPLGKGAFGRVYLARDKMEQIPFALKIIFKSKLKTKNMEENIIREIVNHTHLVHPNIIRLYNYFYDDTKIYIMLEYALNGEVYKVLGDCGRFVEEDAAKYIYQVADALEYCHQKKVIHRDLKPENLLFDDEYNIKLADFGWSVHSTKHRETFCGTLDYLAPELVNAEAHSFYVDYWCVGVLLYEFLTGVAPFMDKTEVGTYKRIKTGLFSIPDHVSKGATNLLNEVLKVQPEERLDLVGVMSHPWTQSHLKQDVNANQNK